MNYDNIYIYILYEESSSQNDFELERDALVYCIRHGFGFSCNKVNPFAFTQ